MHAPYYHCEECGYEFEKTEFVPDVEDDMVVCPSCGSFDLQLEAAETKRAA